MALTPRGHQFVHKPEVVLTRPTKRWRHLTGERWQERLVELRRHIADLERKDLFERLAETWPPEVRASYHRELLQLSQQLRQLARRLADMRGKDHDDQ